MALIHANTSFINMPQYAIINSLKDKLTIEAKAGMVVFTTSNNEATASVSITPDDMDFVFDAIIKIGQQLTNKNVPSSDTVQAT